MRKMQKDSIVELVNLLKKAQEHVKNLLLQREYASVLDLLQQCQQGAIQIGTTIEEAEGEGFPTVEKLEEYCELIFQVFEMVQGGMEQTESGEGACKPDADVIFGAMDRLLFEIEESIQRDIEVRKEIVFLPYKASMWDSLESVWMAADADPECDAYVVPIPYFDKNPDGSAKEMHYEGDLYPDYVPITHYDDYDIAQRHPDMIYIHNPYDEANYVTSVHPAFYSKRLKELTDCLVYIPYFVLGEINPGDKTAVKGMEHFVTLPGVIHAHKVIVQSQDMRQIYIDVMSELVGEETRHYWEEKILGTGSPKFDKICSTQKDTINIPQEWLKLIEKPNGEWKKVIFYNISVTSMLRQQEQLLEKMKKVFYFFEKNRDDFVLLWRPHPLIKATVESMRPHLWEKYKEILEEYLKSGFGIYDDTPDMDRAIALCDAYYGDSSSIVSLCKEAKKPAMIQTFGKEATNCVLFEDFCIKDRKLFFVARDINMVCTLDLDSGETEIWGKLLSENMLERRVASKIDLWKNEMIFTPLNSGKVEIYNTAEHSRSEIEVKEKGVGLKFFQTILFDRSLFLIGGFYPSILKLDLEGKKITYLDEVFAQLPKRYEESGKGFFLCDYAKVDDKVYFATCCGNLVLEFDLRTEKHAWIPVGSEGNEYSGIFWDGKYFWLSPRENTPIVRWDGKSEVQEIKLPHSNELSKGTFLGVSGYRGSVIFPGTQKTWILHSEDEIDVSEMQYTCYKSFSDDFRVWQDSNGMVCVDECGIEKIYTNCLSEEAVAAYFEKNKESMLQALAEKRCVESSIFDMERFLRLICTDFCERGSVERKNAGGEIWEEIKGIG